MMLELIKDKIRVYMNDIADHMAGGGCQDHEEYREASRQS